MSLDVTHHLFMSVVWVNFLGYMFETPALVYMTQLRRRRESPAREIVISLLIGFGAVAVVGILSSAALYLDSITDEWFSCAAFILLWCGVFAKLVATLVRRRKHISFRGEKDRVLFLFWAAIYAYCLAGLWSLGVLQRAIFYGALSVFLMIMTLALSLIQIEEE